VSVHHCPTYPCPYCGASFPAVSSFSEQVEEIKIPDFFAPIKESPEDVMKRLGGADDRTLEEWYSRLGDALESMVAQNQGEVRATIQDVRDDIYRYLR
jgi:hypothetical protein